MLCLTNEQINSLKPKLKEVGGKGLITMTSQERKDFFSEAIGNKVAGEFVTASFEKAMVSKQKNALKSWAQNAFNEKEKTKLPYFAVLKKIDNLTERGVLSPNAVGGYLDTLISTQLGVEVTGEEVSKINELSDKIKAAKVETEADVTNEKKRIAYGNTVIDMYDYVQTIAPVKNQLIADIANLPKSLMSTLDFSAPFRQGWGMMSRVEFYKSFAAMFKFAFNKQSFKDLQADIISRPTYELMKRSGLRVSVLAEKLSQREEQFMSTLIDRIPVPEKANFVKNFMEGSERAYSGFLSKLRADTFDNLVKAAEMAGEDINPRSQTLKDIAAVVNDFTGSGNIGKGDRYSGAVPLLNAGFFAPRKVSATVNMLNPERYLNPNISVTARKAALRQLIGSVAISALLLGLRNLFADDKDKAELDPRSADFGKVKFNNTHIDLTGGNSTYAVLLARLISNRTKSTVTDQVTKLGEGFNSSTRFDVATSFGRNKLSPLASFVADWLAGGDAVGNPFNLTKEVTSRFIPLIIGDTISLAKEDPSNLFVGTLANTFGFGAQVYAPKELSPEEAKKKDTADKKQAKLDAKIEKVYGKDNKTVNQIVQTLSESSKANATQKAKYVADIMGYGDNKKAEEYKRNGVISQGVYDKYKTLKEGDKVPEVKQGEQSEKSVISQVVTYANAIGTDPLTAFNRILTGQRIRRVDSGAIIVERMSLDDSEAVKKSQGSSGDMKLDHTLPLELGGSNAEANLKLVPESVWKQYTPVENFLGKRLRSGEIDKDTAQKLIKQFKDGDLNAQQVYDTVNNKSKE